MKKALALTAHGALGEDRVSRGDGGAVAVVHCSDGVLTVEGSIGGGDPPATLARSGLRGVAPPLHMKLRTLGARLLPGEDAEHHTRDGYAPQRVFRIRGQFLSQRI